MKAKSITHPEFIELLKEADLGKLNGVIVSALKNLQGEIVLVTPAGCEVFIGHTVKLELWYSDTISYVKTIFGVLHLYRFTGLPVDKILK